MKINKKITKDEEHFRNLEKELEKQYNFKKGDFKKKFTKRNIVLAGAMAFELMEGKGDITEFFNLFLSILYGEFEFED